MTRCEIIIACGDDLDDNLSRTIANLRRTIGPNDRICVVYDRPRQYATFQPDRQIVNPRSIGCGGSRHLGIASSDAEFVALVDAHMDFPAGWVDEAVDHLTAHPRDITCAHMQSISAEWTDHPGQRYAGAHMTHFQVAPICEPYPFSARWNRADVGKGEIGCAMGACYVMRRNRYLNIGSPLATLRVWGMDEEMLSVSNWLLGGRTWLVPAVVRHVFAAPKRGANDLTLSQCVEVWVNRLYAVRAFPMAAELRREYEQHLLKKTFVASNFGLMDGLANERRPEKHRYHTSQLGRTFEDYCGLWLVEGETPEEKEHMKRRQQADTKRKATARPVAPAPAPEVAPPVAKPDDTPFPCPHCGRVDIAGHHAVLNTYPNGRTRYRCVACAMPFIRGAQ